MGHKKIVELLRQLDFKVRNAGDRWFAQINNVVTVKWRVDDSDKTVEAMSKHYNEHYRRLLGGLHFGINKLFAMYKYYFDESEMLLLINKQTEWRVSIDGDDLDDPILIGLMACYVRGDGVSGIIGDRLRDLGIVAV